MTPSLFEKIKLANFGHMTISTIAFEPRDKR